MKTSALAKGFENSQRQTINLQPERVQSFIYFLHFPHYFLKYKQLKTYFCTNFKLKFESQSIVHV